MVNVQKLESMAPEFQTLTDSLKKTSTPASILVDKNGQPSPPKPSRHDGERPSPSKYPRLEAERPSPPKPARVETEKPSPPKPEKSSPAKPGRTESGKSEDKSKRSSSSHSHHRYTTLLNQARYFQFTKSYHTQSDILSVCI